MKKTKIYLIGAIFGFISSVGFIIIMSSIASVLFSIYTHPKQTSFFVGGIIGVFGWSLSIIGGIGAFVSGIIQIIKADEQPERTLAILSGIFNIVGSAVLVGPILSLIVHIKQKKISTEEVKKETPKEKQEK